MRIFLLTIFIFSSAYLSAQTYMPFPTDSVKWTDGSQNNVSCSPNTPTPCCFEIEYVIEKDTLISGILYHKLLGYPTAYPGCGNPFYSPIISSTIEAGYFRNDSISKKVYYKKDDQSAEVLFYDFDLVLNQMYPWTFLNDSTGDSTSSASPWRVDSISQDTLFGQVRDIYHINDTGRNTPTVDLIEGVGSSVGFLASWEDLRIIPLSFYFLGQCWKGLDKDLRPCALAVGEKERSNKEIEEWSYRYNSVNQNIEFIGDHTILELIIYNLSGQKVGEYRPQADQVRVNLKKGIYLLQAIDQEGIFHSGKLVVN